MRKTWKLLTLVLALTLVFGTLALAISAADSTGNLTVTANGVTQYTSADFATGLDANSLSGSTNGGKLIKHIRSDSNGNQYQKQQYSRYDQEYFHILQLPFIIFRAYGEARLHLLL